jgi:hypothetical protein
LPKSDFFYTFIGFCIIGGICYKLLANKDVNDALKFIEMEKEEEEKKLRRKQNLYRTPF